MGSRIIGRSLDNLIEIDAKKLGRVEEEDENNKKLEKVLDQKFSDTGDLVFIES